MDRIPTTTTPAAGPRQDLPPSHSFGKTKAEQQAEWQLVKRKEKKKIRQQEANERKRLLRQSQHELAQHQR